MNLVRSLQIASLAAFSTVAAHAVVIDFTGATSFADNFSTPFGSYGRSATLGVAGGAGLDIFNSNPAFYTGATDSIPALSATDSVTISVFFNRTTVTYTSGGQRIAALGLASSGAALASNTGGLGTAPLTQGNFGFVIQTNAATATGVTQARVRSFDSANETAPTVSANLGTTFNLNDSTWYKFSVTFSKSATVGSWNGVMTVQDFGLDGQTAGSVLYSLSSTVLTGTGATAMYGDASIFAGLSGESTRVGAFDNFALTSTVAAVPEPASFAIFAGFGVLGLAAFRRRRSGR
jgi:hypothetical protein